MHEVGGEPAIGERRAVGAPENDGAGLAQIVDHRAVAARDDIALQFKAVGRGEAFLIDIDFDGDRHAGQRTDRLACSDRGIDGGGLGQHIVGAMVDDGVDGRVDRVQPRQRRRRHLFRRNLF